MTHSVASLDIDLSAVVRLDQRARCRCRRSASLEVKQSPLQISHLKQFPVTTISFNLAPGASLGAAVDAINAALADIGLPASFGVNFQGAAQAFQASLSNEVFLLLAAILTMYIVLGVLYESFIHPITILSTLPSAGIGALLSLELAGAGLDIIGVIGIVLLIGIVKKNAIMMIDFALDAQRHRGARTRATAIYQACLLRLRPILMTTVAAMFGALPLMLGTGVGSELRHPLGLAIVGGLAVSQVLTLFTTPVIYLFFERIAAAPRRRLVGRPAAGGGAVNNRFSELFIRRPVATTLLTIGIALAGLLAFTRLPVSPLPQVDFPNISVSATMPGASPDTMASSVAAPLERHLGQIADVNEMTSTSSLGSTRIQLQFGLDRDIDGAARDVQAAINAARADLPTSLRSNPTYHKINPADAPIMVLALTSTTRTAGQIYDIASNVLQQRLSQLDGIGEVDVVGSALAGGAGRARSRRAVQIRHRPRGRPRRARRRQRQQPEGRDRGRRLPLSDLRQRPGDQGRPVSRSRRRLPQRRRGQAQPTSPRSSIRSRICATPASPTASRRSAIVLSRQPGANIIQAVDGVKAELPRLAASLPGDVDLNVVVDRSITIRGSLADTERTLLTRGRAGDPGRLRLPAQRARRRRSRASPCRCRSSARSRAMYLLGYSLDNLSLMALTISTGFVVDDAIVVLENITPAYRAGRDRGSRPRSSARARSASPCCRSACR